MRYVLYTILFIIAVLFMVFSKDDSECFVQPASDGFVKTICVKPIDKSKK